MASFNLCLKCSFANNNRIVATPFRAKERITWKRRDLKWRYNIGVLKNNTFITRKWYWEIFLYFHLLKLRERWWKIKGKLSQVTFVITFILTIKYSATNHLENILFIWKSKFRGYLSGYSTIRNFSYSNILFGQLWVELLFCQQTLWKVSFNYVQTAKNKDFWLQKLINFET